MTHYFISYARADAQDVANELTNRLRAQKHEVFFDVQSILSGAEWKKELIKQIKWCDVLLILVTNGSNDSDYVYAEFEQAVKNNKTIIPISIDNASLPVHLRKYNGVLSFDRSSNNYADVLLSIQKIPNKPIISWQQVFSLIPYSIATIVGIILGVIGVMAIPPQAPQAPIAFISSPLDYASVQRKTEVGGFYRPNDLLDQQLFVFVEPLNDRYYPQIPSGCDVNNRISVNYDATNGLWRLPVYVGSVNDSPESVYELSLMVANENATENLYRRFDEWCEQGSFPGFSEAEIQQLGLEKIDSITVTRPEA